ncbi:MAG: protein kinase [Pirellulaceae bacterium]|nr:protein kinase [Pirellulaceae bacterium]
MSFTSTQLWQRLIAEGLASEVRCKVWATEVARSLPPRDQTNGIKVLKWLIESGDLTNYQARALAGQSQDVLRRGDWHILRRVAQPIWSGWYEITKVGMASGKQSEPVWGRWISRQQAEQARASADGLPRVVQLSSLKSRHVQAVEPPELADGQLLLRVRPVDGTLLSHRQPTAPPVRETIAQIMQTVRQLTQALADLHAARIVHGRVLPDRVALDSRRAVTLICDPLTSATVASDATEKISIVSGVLAASLPGMNTDDFLPPELLISRPALSLASDVYMLGATWWWLLTGAAPTDRSSINQPAASTGAKPDFANADLRLEQPLLDCLKLCLAKQPSDRLADATAVLEALNAATSASPSRLRSPGKIDSVDNGAQSANSSEAKSSRAAQVGAQQPIPVVSKHKKRWMLAVIMGSLVLVGGLLVLGWNTWSLVLTPAPTTVSQLPDLPTQSVESQPIERDPLQDRYRITDSSDLPWAPPWPAEPLRLDLLPPGAQLILSWHPARISTLSRTASWVDVMRNDRPWDALLSDVAKATGLPLEALKHVLVAYYPERNEDRRPEQAFRVELVQGMTRQQLLAAWATDSQESAATMVDGGRSNRIIRSGLRSYYLGPVADSDAQQASAGSSQLIESFGVGPSQLMMEVAQQNGVAGTIQPHLARLLERTHRDCDLCLLCSPRFLNTEGRWLMEQLPERMRQVIGTVLPIDARAVLMQTSFAPQWYWEFQMIGASDADSPRLARSLNQSIRQARQQTAAWLNSRQPHPHWRELAQRLPGMLGAWSDYTRVGVEDGAVIANGYLPADAQSGLVTGAWTAMQDWALPDGEVQMQSNR